MGLLRKIIKKSIRFILQRVDRVMSGDMYRIAEAENLKLYADTSSLSSSEIKEFNHNLEKFGKAREYTKEYTEHWKLHSPRLILSTKHLKSLIKDFHPNARGIETGEPTIATDLLNHYLDSVEWETTKTDLRYDWEYPDEYVDIIVSTEVIEHLSDIPVGFQDKFSKSGLLAFLKESFRVLKSNGILFISTPNSASILHLAAVLRGDPPWFFQEHVREYTIKELQNIVEQAGFIIESIQTVHCLTAHTRNDYSFLFYLLLKYHYDINNRGDDIFLSARKP